MGGVVGATAPVARPLNSKSFKGGSLPLAPANKSKRETFGLIVLRYPLYGALPRNAPIFSPPIKAPQRGPDKTGTSKLRLNQDLQDFGINRINVKNRGFDVPVFQCPPPFLWEGDSRGWGYKIGALRGVPAEGAAEDDKIQTFHVWILLAGARG